MKALSGAFNQDKAQVGVVTVIVKTSWTFVSSCSGQYLPALECPSRWSLLAEADKLDSVLSLGRSVCRGRGGGRGLVTLGGVPGEHKPGVALTRAGGVASEAGGVASEAWGVAVKTRGVANRRRGRSTSRGCGTPSGLGWDVLIVRVI